MSNLISVAELHGRLGDPVLRLADVRASLTDPEAGRRLYGAGHLPGAFHLDLGSDLSGPVAAHGGRHPLPDMFGFADTLRAHGVGDESEVVVYDDSGGMFAARLWWLLRYAGLLPQARFVVFHCADRFGTTPYYESLDLIEAHHRRFAAVGGPGPPWAPVSRRPWPWRRSGRRRPASGRGRRRVRHRPSRSSPGTAATQPTCG